MGTTTTTTTTTTTALSTTTADNGGCPDSISRRSGRLIMASGIATRSLLSLSTFAVLSAGAPLVVTALVAAPIIFSPSGIQIIAPVSTGTGTTFDPFATFPQIQVNLLRGIVN